LAFNTSSFSFSAEILGLPSLSFLSTSFSKGINSLSTNFLIVSCTIFCSSVSLKSMLVVSLFHLQFMLLIHYLFNYVCFFMLFFFFYIFLFCFLYLFLFICQSQIHVSRLPFSLAIYVNY